MSSGSARAVWKKKDYVSCPVRLRGSIQFEKSAEVGYVVWGRVSENEESYCYGRGRGGLKDKVFLVWTI